MQNPTRPILKYHGGKWRLASWIISHFPPHRIYTEPFGGAGSVILLKPKVHTDVYNDRSGDVVNVFRVLRDARLAKQLEDALRLTPYARDEFEEAYETMSDPVEKARRTIIRSYMGWGGYGTNIERNTGFRSDCKRAGTHAATNWSDYPDQIAAYMDALRGVVVENTDAKSVLEQHDTPDTLHYVDPPYPHGERITPGAYQFEMTDEEHRELAAALHSLDGMVILSGYACDLYDDELYAGWERSVRDVWANGRVRAVSRTEVLWLNPAAAQKRPQLRLFES